MRASPNCVVGGGGRRGHPFCVRQGQTQNPIGGRTWGGGFHLMRKFSSVTLRKRMGKIPWDKFTFLGVRGRGPWDVPWFTLKVLIGEFMSQHRIQNHAGCAHAPHCSPNGNTSSSNKTTHSRFSLKFQQIWNLVPPPTHTHLKATIQHPSPPPQNLAKGTERVKPLYDIKPNSSISMIICRGAVGTPPHSPSPPHPLQTSLMADTAQICIGLGGGTRIWSERWGGGGKGSPTLQKWFL